MYPPLVVELAHFVGFSITMYQSMLGDYLTQAVGSLHTPSLRFVISLLPLEAFRTTLEQRHYVSHLPRLALCGLSAYLYWWVAGLCLRKRCHDSLRERVSASVTSTCSAEDPS